MNAERLSIHHCPHCGLVIESATMPRCLHCTAPMREDWTFCAECGAERGAPVAVSKQPVTATEGDRATVVAHLEKEAAARFRRAVSTKGPSIADIVARLVDVYVERGMPRIQCHKHGRVPVTLNMSSALYKRMQELASARGYSVRGFARGLLVWGIEEGLI